MIDASDARQLAEIANRIAGEQSASAWNFTRGVVDAVSSENVADIYIEGHDDLTSNVPALITYNPRVGDRVLVLRIGRGNSNLVLFGVLPSGTYKVGEWYEITLNSPWQWYGSPFSEPYVTIDSHARVRIRGSIKDPNAPSYSPPGYSYPGAVATLPSKFRPPEEIWIPTIGHCDGFTIPMYLIVTPAGVMYARNPEQFQEGPPIAWMALDNVSYKAA